MKIHTANFVKDAKGDRYETRGWYPMPVPAGIEPTHYLIGSRMIPASALPGIVDADCVISWSVILEETRENTPLVDVAHSPVPLVPEVAKSAVTVMQPLPELGGMTPAEHQLLYRK